MKLSDIPSPVNREERIQYEMLVRLDALCNMLSSVIEHIAEKESVATTSNTVVDEISTVEEVEKITTLTPTRCVATTSKGTQCKNDALDGSDYCFVHTKE